MLVCTTYPQPHANILTSNQFTDTFHNWNCHRQWFPDEVGAYNLTGYPMEFAKRLIPLASTVSTPTFLDHFQFLELILQPLCLAISSEPGQRNAIYTNMGGYGPNIIGYDPTL